MNRLNGKVIIVTGGALGIGRACVERASEEGASVAILNVLDEPGQALAAQLRAQGRKVAYWHCDMSSESQVMAAIDGATAHFGALTTGAFHDGCLSRAHFCARLPQGIAQLHLTVTQLRSSSISGNHALADGESRVRSPFEHPRFQTMPHSLLAQKERVIRAGTATEHLPCDS